MIVIRGIRVPPIDELSDKDLTDILDKIIKFAKSQRQGSERETFDFKQKLKIKDKDEIRKDFSSFANTHGGLIIVGIDDGCGLVGIQNIPKDEQLSEILSIDGYINPPVKFSSRVIDFQDKKVLLYYIPESHVPIEVKKNGQWVAYARNNNTTRILNHVEIILKFYRGAKKLPDHTRVDISQLSFYSSIDDSREPYFRWTIKNQGALYKWLKLPYMPLIPIPTMPFPYYGTVMQTEGGNEVPTPAMPFQYQPELYYSLARWVGSDEKLFEMFEIIDGIEKNLQELGIGFEIWTIPLSGAKTYIEDHHYISGCGANNLRTSLEYVHKNQSFTIFGWILFSSVTVIVTGKIHKTHCSIMVQSIFNFIPNNFPFISIDDIGRVILEPLPAHRMDWWKNTRVVEWKSKDFFPWEDDISDELLVSAPSARIKGYMGDMPRPRDYDSPVRTNGITLLDIANPYNKSTEYGNPLLDNIESIFCRISSAPGGLCDLKEVKIGRIKLSALPISRYPFYDLHLVFFDIDCYVNQSKSYRMMAQRNEISLPQ